MNESYLLLEKKLKPKYKIFFEKNKSNIEYLENQFNNLTLSSFTKENPNIIFAYIFSFGISALIIKFLIKLEKEEFNEQINIWKSLNKKKN